VARGGCHRAGTAGLRVGAIGERPGLVVADAVSCAGGRGASVERSRRWRWRKGSFSGRAWPPRRVLRLGMGADAGPPGPFACVGYLAALGTFTRHELRWMGRAAVVVP